MLDVVIKGGTVIDGTGAAGVAADVGVRDGRIVTIGTITESANETIDATGLLVTPGFVDPHTHYDAQLIWDPTASPSLNHGVTSVIGGNCGFTLAPLRAVDADYTRKMMAKVEGMALAALEQGIEWNWESFAQYLDRLDGRIAINAGFLVGHCAIRRYVMGPAAVGEKASPEQVAAMQAELSRSLAAGGLGFSTTLSKTHSDGDGKPVASRWSDREEVLALCEVVGRHEGTTLEGIVEGCLEMFAEPELDLIIAMSAAARRPFNWNVLTIDSGDDTKVNHQLEAGTRAAAAGARVVALTMPVAVPMNMSFKSFCALWLLPGWQETLGVPVDERIRRLSDPLVRTELASNSQKPEAGIFRRLTDWGRYVIGDTYADANQGCRGRRVSEIAAERGTTEWDTVLDICVTDELATILWPSPHDGGDKTWALRKQVWLDERAMIGGSDAGAHLDRMCGAPYTTRFVADCIRGRQLIPVETAVKLMTRDPARLFGLRDRGELRVGGFADIAVFDPATVGSENAELVTDLPGQSARLTAGSIGMHRVLVNGVVAIRDGQPTGSTSGTLLRSGRDTDTVDTSTVRRQP